MNLKHYLKKAKKEKWAIGQFNFSTLEQLRGILAAAQRLRASVILGLSPGELSYLGLEEAVALVEIEKMKYGVDAFLNLDHAKDFNVIRKAIDYGFSAIHFDYSSPELEKNIKYAKKKGVLVEGTFPGVDSFTVDIGNLHGIHRNIKLDFEKLKEINRKTNAFLVLHGGSGIPDSQIKKAIKLGIVKINVNTELRIAWKRSLAALLKTQKIRPYEILADVEISIQKKVEEKLRLFSDL